MLSNVFDDFYRLNKEMNKFLYGRDGTQSRYWPEVNIYENENEFAAVAKVPGLAKEEINISVKDNSLKIAGNRNTNDQGEVNYHLRERKNGNFERNFLLNEKIDVEKITAEMKNGLLLIKIPKSPESKPFKVEIK